MIAEIHENAIKKHRKKQHIFNEIVAFYGHLKKKAIVFLKESPASVRTRVDPKFSNIGGC